MLGQQVQCDHGIRKRSTQASSLKWQALALSLAPSNSYGSSGNGQLYIDNNPTVVASKAVASGRFVNSARLCNVALLKHSIILIRAGD